ncbi:MAG: MFS transporter [Chloroflexota bacterium]|nr:MFS transporter [Chloroflexota bacterium]
MVSAIASGVNVNPTIGVFVKPLTEEFGWSRSVIAGAVAVGTILGGILALVIGPIIDRFGARWILFIGFLLMGGLLIALSGIHNLWQFYAIIIMTRLLLQGIINLTNQTVLAKWFVRKRGRALAYGNLGQRFGQGAVPFAAQMIITAASWRVAATAMGLFAWGLTLIPVLLWMRRKPEDMGLQPDGDQHPGETAIQATSFNTPNHQRTSEVHFTLTEALRTKTFYVLLATLCLTSFVNTGVNFNLIPYLSDKGLNDSQAVTILLIWSFTGIPAALFSGLLSERLSVQWVMVGFQAGMIIGTILLLSVDILWIGVVFALVHGASFAGSLLAQQVILADYYGSAHLGALRGVVLPWQMAANAVGPLAATLVFDIRGDYTAILWLYVLIQLVVLMALLRASPPKLESVPGFTGQ